MNQKILFLYLISLNFSHIPELATSFTVPLEPICIFLLVELLFNNVRALLLVVNSASYSYIFNYVFSVLVTK